MAAHPPLCQIAFSVTDLARTHRWYQDVFGFLPAGGTRLFRGPIASRVQGLPNAASTCWWLVDRQEFFQLELFEFVSPPVRPLPADWRPCDTGYTMVGLHVADFDATLARLASHKTRPLTAPVGPAGQRRVCVRDPEGVMLELLEDDPCTGFRRDHERPEIPVSACSVTLSVPDLERSRRFFVDTLGLPVLDGLRLHGPEHEALWGLAGAQRKSLVVRSGDCVLELVQYENPVGKPWPDGYRISDQGLLNIALGFRSKAAFDAAYARCAAAGYRGNWRPFNLGAWSVVYVNDDQGFSVELLFVRPWYDAPMGFRPAMAYVNARTRIAAPPDAVWRVITDHAGMSKWTPLECALIRPGTPEPNGLGAVRRLTGPGTTIEEEVVRWEPLHRFDYRLTKGAPMRDHSGHVFLTPDGDGTRVQWTVSFRPLIPGTGPVLRTVLQRAFDGALRKLKSLVEARQ